MASKIKKKTLKQNSNNIKLVQKLPEQGENQGIWSARGDNFENVLHPAAFRIGALLRTDSKKHKNFGGLVSFSKLKTRATNVTQAKPRIFLV